MKNYDSQIKKDFDWIFKILKSCETQIHFNVSESCYELWCKKWSHLFNDRTYQYMLGCFKARYEVYKKQKEQKYGWSSNISK